MGCCLFASVLAGAPRLALAIWWFSNPARFGATFESFLLPLVGFFFLPWTTLAYVFVAPHGLGIFDVIILVFAIFTDLGTHGGGAAARRRSR